MNIFQTARITLTKVARAFKELHPSKETSRPDEELIYPDIDTSFLGDAGPLPGPALHQNLTFWSKYVRQTVLIGMSEQPGCCAIYLEAVDSRLDRLSFRHVHLLEKRQGIVPDSIPVGQICIVPRQRCYFVAKIDAVFRQTGVKP